MWSYLRARDVLNQGLTVQAWTLWHIVDYKRGSQPSFKRVSGLKGSLQNPQREVTDEDGTIRRL